MVDLPTFKNLTNQQAQVLLETFRPFPEATQQETVDAFLAKLRDWLMLNVKEKKRQQKRQEMAAAMVLEEQQIEQALPPAPMPTPPAPPEPSPEPAPDA